MKAPQLKSRSERNCTLLRSLPFFQGLTDKEFADLKHIFVERHYGRNKTIFLEEDTLNYMYIILSGKVKVIHSGFDGKEHIVAIHQKGDFFGEMALLDGKTSPATVVALEDTLITIISSKDFEKYLLKNDKILRQTISILCTRLREAWMMIKVLSLPNAEDRVRAVITIVSDYYGYKDARGTVLSSRLTHQNIADYSFVSRETVTRLMSRFAKEGEIEVLENKDIVLKPSFERKSVGL
ncbi:MAG TPA: Crp/Fnr family transcriptional regulator [Dissulfurispiraceae bacterium]|nr:Crp/Fnr family transcriptional regulator [Dissulfurispiraceae bacterium]